ncbi:hypothetical protein [Leifsonia sp. NPDC058230]|uniref:hypothetical protein n=1 Tax=Leifsonia sp. NPDC058230 TaxID=3346391 RepID=UPI0036D862B6
MTVLGEAAIVRRRSVPLERTPQRLDPLGVQSAWALVPILGVVAVAYAVYSTVTHGGQLHDPVLAWIAVGVLALAGAVFAVRTHPARAPFGFWSHVSIIGACVVAASLFSTAMWGSNQRIQDDWGQVVVAMLVTAMALYRPIPEVIAVAGLAALILGATAALQAPFLAISTNPLVYFTVAATPIMALALAGCGYAWTMTGETLAWREVARAAQARLEPELRETARRMVNQERITTLNQATVPFLADLLRRGEVTEQDARRARELAAGLRGASVAAVDRTWLGETLAQVLAARGEEASALQTTARVTDPGRLERILRDEQRAVVGAILSTLAKLPGLDPSSVRIEARDPEHPSFELTCRASGGRRQLRRELLPFLSALRSVGMNASMRVSDDKLTVRFSYPGGENR